MPNVKKVICGEETLATIVETLKAEGWDRVDIYFSGHPRQKEFGVMPGHVLLQAYNFVSRANTAKARDAAGRWANETPSQKVKT